MAPPSWLVQLSSACSCNHLYNARHGEVSRVALASGTRLGPYEIESAVGAGGMGEVYRARDTRLERSVAVKVLPSHLSSNAELRQRFEREARVLSSLSYPHICTVHDVGHQDGIDFLVMEYLEGETLAHRLERGSLPLDQVLKIAVEIAGALDRAHCRGVIHRDLKPSNIMLTRTGAKLMDFGLAKPVGFAVAAGASTAARTFTPATPTMSLNALSGPAGPLTQHGMVVGTFQYMAPEVLQGAEADARSDIFSFGAVLYEMVTGKPAFEGKSQLSVLAAILDKDPEPISKLRPVAPPALDHSVSTCLEKDPEDRWQSAHDLKRELEWVGKAEVVVPKRSGPLKLITSSVLALLLAGAGLAGGWWTWRAPAAPAASTLRFRIEPPPGTSFTFIVGFAPAPPALSPDGNQVVFGAMDTVGRSKLWVQRLDSYEATPLSGTEDSSYPFWSPDARYIGFFAHAKLQKILAGGGVAEALCDAPNGRGGTWSRSGVILFAPDNSGGLLQVTQAGGSPQPVNAPATDNISYRWPSFLPDGDHFLFTSARAAGANGPDFGVFVASLSHPQPRRVLADVSNALYSGGTLFFARGRMLEAAAFDERRLEITGDAVPVEPVDNNSARGHAVFSISGHSVLVWPERSNGPDQLTWLNREGKIVGTLGAEKPISWVRISPDGQHVATVISEPGSSDLWIIDLARKLQTRATFSGQVNRPVWSPDGTQIAYSAPGPISASVYVHRVDGTSADRVLPFKGAVGPVDWSRDGKYLVCVRVDSIPVDIWSYSFADGKWSPLVQNGFNNTAPGLSPDGRWLAYVSDENTQREIYVRPFRGADRKWQISNSGGLAPRWTAHGRELDYIAPDGKLMAVSIGRGEDFVPSTPRALMALPNFVLPEFGWRYDVTPDGSRILYSRRVGEPSRSRPLNVIVNWQPPK